VKIFVAENTHAALHIRYSVSLAVEPGTGKQRFFAFKQWGFSLEACACPDAALDAGTALSQQLQSLKKIGLQTLFFH
jgi:hypothetical protein